MTNHAANARAVSIMAANGVVGAADGQRAASDSLVDDRSGWTDSQSRREFCSPA
ncbi:MAG: hypothetical protein ABMA15_05970 [Vicinamibacterales bacterium]